MKVDKFDQDSIAHSFWASIFTKPSIALYYLEDWLDYLKKESDVNQEDVLNAQVWMAFVDNDDLLLLKVLQTEKYRMLCQSSQLYMLFKMYAASSLGEKCSDELQVVFNDEQLENALLFRYLIATIEYNSRRYQKSRLLLNSALSLHKRSYESEKHKYILGLVYELLIKISLKQEDDFEVDEWSKKLKRLIDYYKIEALSKRYDLLRMQILRHKDRVEKALDVWTIDSTSDWANITDELSLILKANYLEQLGRSKDLRDLYDKLRSSYQLQFAGEVIQFVLNEMNNFDTSEILNRISNNPYYGLFASYLRFKDRSARNKNIEILNCDNQLILTRVHIGDLCQYSIVSNKTESVSKDRVLIKTFLRLIESIQKDHVVGELGLESDYFSKKSYVLQALLLQNARKKVRVSEFLSFVETLCSWSEALELHYVKKEWQTQSFIRKGFIDVVWQLIVHLLDSDIGKVNVHMSHSIKNERVSIDCDFDLSPLASRAMRKVIQVRQLFDQFSYIVDQLYSEDNESRYELNMLELDEMHTIKWQIELLK